MCTTQLQAEPAYADVYWLPRRSCRRSRSAPSSTGDSQPRVLGSIRMRPGRRRIECGRTARDSCCTFRRFCRPDRLRIVQQLFSAHRRDRNEAELNRERGGTQQGRGAGT